MGAGTAKFKSLTALGEGHVAMLLDRGSIPLASTNQVLHEHPLLQRWLCCYDVAAITHEKSGKDTSLNRSFFCFQALSWQRPIHRILLNIFVE